MINPNEIVNLQYNTTHVIFLDERSLNSKNEYNHKVRVAQLFDLIAEQENKKISPEILSSAHYFKDNKSLKIE